MYYPAISDVRAIIQEAYEDGCLTLDIENVGEHPLEAEIRIVGIGTEHRAVVVPFLMADGTPYWRPRAERQVRSLIKSALEDPKLAKRGHNMITHDLLVLGLRGFGNMQGELRDTLVAMHVADSELPMSLAWGTARHTECPYYKDMVTDPEAKGGLDWGKIPHSVLATYNARDVLTCARMAPKIDAEIAWPEGRALYLEEIQVNHQLREMCVTGLRVDLRAQKKMAKALHETAVKRAVEMQRVLGDTSFNPGSVPALRRALFETLGFPYLKGKAYWTKGGQPSTGKQTLFELSLRASDEQTEFVQALSTWRKATKLEGTYVGHLQADGSVKGGPEILRDGKVHPTWRMLTKTGRYACTPAVNTLPKKIKSIYVADPGHVFLATDLSQAELRTIATFMQVPRLLEAYSLGLDAHTINTVTVFQVRPPKDYKTKTQDWLRANLPGYAGLPIDDEFDSGARWITKRATFATAYQATAETVWRTLRADTDPETGELLFPSITLGQVMDFREAFRHANSEIPAHAHRMLHEIQAQGFYQSPLSGRRIWFSRGCTLQDAANNPIQEAIAAYMNKKILALSARLAREFKGTVRLAAQVHDSFVLHAPITLVARVRKTLEDVLAEPVPYVQSGVKKLFHVPADPVRVGVRLSEV